MSRVGLQQLSTSARNSPFDNAKTHNGKVAPLKINNLKKYQPITPSPLTNNSPFSVLAEQTKENRETQTFQPQTIGTQTTITVPILQPQITEEDLTSEKPTANYLRCLADRLKLDLEDEQERGEKLVEELNGLDEKLRKVEDDTQILMEVLADIDEEQGTSAL